MSIVFYQAPVSSASPVVWALAEVGVPFESVKVDLAAGEQRKPGFLKLNPNGKVPTLVVDGTPMFEALAIMTWLGDRFGVEKKLWPATDDPARLQAVSWSTWAYVTFGPAIHLLNVASSPRSAGEAAERRPGGARARADPRAPRDPRCAPGGQPYILGASFSIADVIDARRSWVRRHVRRPGRAIFARRRLAQGLPGPARLARSRRARRPRDHDRILVARDRRR